MRVCGKRFHLSSAVLLITPRLVIKLTLDVPPLALTLPCGHLLHDIFNFNRPSGSVFLSVFCRCYSECSATRPPVTCSPCDNRMFNREPPGKAVWQRHLNCWVLMQSQAETSLFLLITGTRFNSSVLSCRKSQLPGILFYVNCKDPRMMNTEVNWSWYGSILSASLIVLWDSKCGSLICMEILAPRGCSLITVIGSWPSCKYRHWISSSSYETKYQVEVLIL